MLFACGGEGADPSSQADETIMTEYSERLSIVMSQNGRRSYHFETPLVEGYTLSREPYREFREGIRITTFRNDSLSEVDAVLTANYAIYYENRKLWEARGNVEVHKWDGKELYTQQLFWNAQTKWIYSNVDTKFVDGTRGVFQGDSFESDEEFKDWRLRYQKSRMEVEMKQADASDSTSTVSSERPVSTRPAPATHSASVPPSYSSRPQPSAADAPVRSDVPQLSRESQKRLDRFESAAVAGDAGEVSVRRGELRK